MMATAEEEWHMHFECFRHIKPVSLTVSKPPAQLNTALLWSMDVQMKFT